MKLPIPSLFKRRWFQFVFVVILLLGGYWYWQNRQAAKNGLETYTVASQNLQKTVTASGKITATKQVTLRFQTIGQLSWVGVKKGDRVEQWQSIAAINQTQLEKSLKQELLDYMNERWDFETTQRDTYKDLALTDVIARAKDKSQFDLDRSVLDVEIADIAKKYATLVTPIAGIVTKSSDEFPGINVSLTGTTYEVTDPESLRFTAEVEETDIGLIREGLPASITLDAFPDEPLTSQVGTIEFTATETTSGNTAYNVYFPLSIDALYRLDMNGDVTIIVEEREDTLVVPIEAVKLVDDKPTVTVLKADKQEPVTITTGLETDDFYEVTGGLTQGDVLVLPKAK
jgi:HlyD family secretion protein